MKHTASILFASLALLALAACNPIPPDSAFLNRGTPESLLDVSSEVVNLSVANKRDTQALSNWIAKDEPTSAQLYCNAQAPSCKDARRILESNHVAVMLTPSPNNTVTLSYERILAHDCKQRYVDTWSSWYNASPASFGCATGANIVQQVSDKREFINPNLSDDPSAVGAVNAINRAYAPKTEPNEKYGVTNSLVKSSGSGGGGS